MDIDELIWGEMANTIAAGCPPYVCVVGAKMPLLYLTVGGVFSLFGQNSYFILHLFHIFWIAGTAWMLTRIFDEKPNLLPGLFYILLMALPGFRILSVTGESLMNPFLILSWVLFLKYAKAPRFLPSLAIGILIAIATLYRHQAAIQLVVYGLAIFLSVQGGIQVLGKELRPKFLMLLWMFLGFLLVLGLMAIILKVWGSWEGFYRWSILHNFLYVKSGGTTTGSLIKGLKSAGNFFGRTLFFWALATFAITKYYRKKDLIFQSALLYLFIGILAALPGLRFYPHYFIQCYPPLVYLTFLGWKALPEKKWIRNTGLSLSILGVLIPHLFINSIFKIDDTKDYASINQRIGQYIGKNTEPGDTIFIWGWAHGIHYYSGRGMGVRLMHSDPLSGRVSGSDPKDYTLEEAKANVPEDAWAIFLEDMNKNKPVYVLNTSPANLHEYGHFPLEAYPTLKEYLEQNYQLETVMEGVEIYRRLGLR